MTRQPTGDVSQAVGNIDQNLGQKCDLKPQDSSCLGRGCTISKDRKSQTMGTKADESVCNVVGTVQPAKVLDQDCSNNQEIPTFKLSFTSLCVCQQMLLLPSEITQNTMLALLHDNGEKSKNIQPQSISEDQKEKPFEKAQCTLRKPH